MQRIVWLGSGAAALLIGAAAIIGLRGTAPPGNETVTAAPVPAAAPPPAPVASAAAPAAKPQAAPEKPSFDVVTVDPKGLAVIAGRAAPGDTVRVLDGGKTLGEVTADARGEWVLVPDKPIPPGNRQLSLEATGHDGGAPRHSDDVVALSVLRPSGSGKSSALAVLLPGEAGQPARVLQEPPWATGVGKLLSLDTASYGAKQQLVLSGRAAPGAHLKVYAGDRLLGTATADAAGHWTLAAAETPPAGGFELWVDQLAADGSVESRIGAPFQPPETTTALAAGGSYVVRRGNSLWVIARDLYGDGTRYTAIFSANRGQIQNPNLIFPGQQFRVPKAVASTR